MLFIGFTPIADGLCPKLDETIIELTMRPVVLWVRGITKAKRRKLHLLQASWAQSRTSNGFPESLAVWRKVALACCGNGDENNMVLQQLFLPTVNRGAFAAQRCA
jgi:hypothetical protein